MCPMSAIIVMEQMSCPSRNIRAMDFDIIVVADVVGSKYEEWVILEGKICQIAHRRATAEE